MVIDFAERYFCKGGAKECENRKFLFKMTELKLNDILRSRGYATVNDMYDELGKPRDPAGLICGWDINDGPIKFNILHDGKFKLHYQITASPLDSVLGRN